MALQSIRLRRALTSLTTLHRSISSPITPTPPPLHLQQQNPNNPSVQSTSIFSSLFQTRSFRGSQASLSSSKKKEYRVYKEGDEITEDMVLFEGCDFNHWLITVDFPKDPAPTPEEMVATYERICAEGLRISIEEAKKRIYACSTTTYQGFQAVMTEEESENFKDVPGVVFVLPDSYIDPKNKQYGGDLYENGVITPRPPPFQNRRAPGRFRDRNRNVDQPRYDQRGGPMPNQHGGPQYNQQGPPQQNYQPPPNYGPPQNYPPQQNYGPVGQGERMPMNSGNYQANRGGPYQSNYSQGQQGYQYPQDHRGFPQGDQRSFGGDNRNFSPSHAGTHGQGANTGYGQGHPGEGQRFLQVEQRSIQGEQENYAPMGQTSSNQGRY